MIECIKTTHLKAKITLIHGVEYNLEFREMFTIVQLNRWFGANVFILLNTFVSLSNWK